jgi:predicted RNA binding protein YcfA (HicA-like mRNA interferase family)
MVKPYREVIKVLKNNGWVYDHTTGSHEIYIKDGKICPIKCNKKDIPAGTLANIKRITGLKF